MALVLEVLAFALAAFYLPRWTPAVRRRDEEQRFTALREDIERTVKGLKNELLDVLEREERMFERIRKREERATGASQVKANNGAEPADWTRSPVEIMNYARQKGMVR